MTIPQTLYWADGEKRPCRFGKLRSEQFSRRAVANSLATEAAYEASAAATRQLRTPKKDKVMAATDGPRPVKGLLPTRI